MSKTLLSLFLSAIAISAVGQPPADWDSRKAPFRQRLQNGDVTALSDELQAAFDAAGFAGTGLEVKTASGQAMGPIKAAVNISAADYAKLTEQQKSLLESLSVTPNRDGSAHITYNFPDTIDHRLNQLEESLFGLKRLDIDDGRGHAAAKPDIPSDAFAPSDDYDYVLSGQGDQVFWLGFSRDGKTLASASGDKTIRIWDVESRKEKGVVASEDLHFGPEGIIFSPDGKTIISALDKKAVRSWDVTSHKESAFLSLPGDVDLVHLAAHENTLAVSFWRTKKSKNSIYLFDLESGKKKKVITSDVHADGIALSPDGATIALASSWTASQGVFLLDANSGEMTSAVSRADKTMTSGFYKWGAKAVAYSSDGNLLAVMDDDGSVYVLNAASGKSTRRQDGKPAERYNRGGTLAFSPDGKLLASYVWADQAGIRLMDVPSGTELGSFFGANTFAFSPDNNTFAYSNNHGIHITSLKKILQQGWEAHEAKRRTAEEARERRAEQERQAAAIAQAVDSCPQEAAHGPMEESLRKLGIQAKVFVEQKKWQEARHAYREMIFQSPGNAPLRFNFAQLEAIGFQDYPAAAAQMKCYLKLAPNASNARGAQDKVYEWEAKVH